jgi:prepilin-type N-terminal cleavage/methylation domain-containing protein
MIIIAPQRKRQRGFSLVEVAVAMAIISIAAFGSLAYQYLGEKHLKIARADFTATRVGQMFIEDWKSVGGTFGYKDPTLLLGSGLNGTYPNYTVTVDGTMFSLSLATNSFPSDPYAGALRQITATVRYRSDFGAGAPGANDPLLVFTTYSR